MLAAARRLADEGFAVMPHFPARGIQSRAELDARVGAYADVGVRQALVIAGGIDPRARRRSPRRCSCWRPGSSTRAGFTELHVAGHPEGNGDIDPAGGDADRDGGAGEEGRLCARDRRAMAIATQFCFDAGPAIAWAERSAGGGDHAAGAYRRRGAGEAADDDPVRDEPAASARASRVLQRRAMD